MSSAQSQESDLDGITGRYSWRHMIDVDQWAQSCVDTKWEYFEARVLNMPSEKHLEAARDVEVARDQPRERRVGLLNQRLHEVAEGDDDQ